MTEVQNDPDRVLHPLRRRADGELRAHRLGRRRSTRSARRLRRVTRRARRRRRSAGTWATPAPSRYSHPLWVKGFLDALGSPHYYTASSQDVTNRFAASPLLYGSPFLLPIPDLARTDLLLVVGANPLVSHGSVMSAPRIKDQLHAIVERGGRVVVVDPRRSETARAFEHVPLEPRHRRLAAALAAATCSSRRALEDADALARQAPGADDAARAGRRASARGHRGADRRSGRAGARARARPRAAPTAPRSTGAPAPASGATARSSPSCSTRSTSRPATSTAPGGAMFGAPPIDFDRIARPARARDLRQGPLRASAASPRCSAQLPASLMAKEITTPGRRADQGAVRLRRKPGALGAQRRRARGRDRASSTSASRSTSTSATPPGTPTSCCRRRPSSSARTSRCRSSASSRTPFIQMTEAGRRARGRGAPGVGDHRGHLPADRDRAAPAMPLPAARASAGSAALAAAAGRPAAALRPEGRPVRPASRAA